MGRETLQEIQARLRNKLAQSRPKREEPMRWDGGAVDGYTTCIADLKRLVSKYSDNDPAEGRLRQKCNEWLQDQYDPAKFEAFTRELDSGQGATNGELARKLNGYLLNPDLTPKLRVSGNHWTWHLDKPQHEQAVNDLQKASLIASFASRLLTTATGETGQLVDDLFQQYFGRPVDLATADTDKAKNTAATKEELAQCMGPGFESQPGHYFTLRSEFFSY